MCRQVQGSLDLGRASFEKAKCNEYSMKTVISYLTELKNDMKEFSYYMKMDSTDMSDFFPLRTAEDLQRFMDKSHEEWPLRRKGFNHLLYTCVTKSKKKFSAGLLHVLFTREYVGNHKWPNPG